MKEVFSCKRCGFCCHGESTVSLDAVDQRNMLDALKISREEALQKYWKVNGNEIQMNIVDGHCIFYENGCSVHKGRPKRCRQWPLVPAILVDINNFITIAATCPGIEQTTTYPDICNRILENQ